MRSFKLFGYVATIQDQQSLDRQREQADEEARRLFRIAAELRGVSPPSDSLGKVDRDP